MTDSIYQADHAEVATSDATAAKQLAAAEELDGAHDGRKAAEERTVSRRPRTETNTAEIDSTIVKPGSVRINVTGAFIVETPEGSPTGTGTLQAGSGAHETKDIRLPNHTAVVSHIAIDVRGSISSISAHIVCGLRVLPHL
jgi:hypothetical protein